MARRPAKPFKPGKDNPGHRSQRPKTGAGRKRGSGNKVTNDIRRHILNALNDVGGETWLRELARRNKRDFSGLFKAIIPRKEEKGMEPEEAAETIRAKVKSMESATTGGDDDGVE